MRISGTKRLFADALLSMMETKPIDSITVQDLLETLNDSLRFIIDFYCYGAVNACREWMKNGM